MSTPGNDIHLLKNGDEIFPAMLEAIRSAENNICFETYVYWQGEIAEEFADALCERSKNGLNVHVLLDWYGSLRMDDELVEQMRDAEVKVEHFRPLKWFNFRRANYRTHRKLLVVDGKTAFTGGVGIAQEWSGNAQDPDHWRDNHYRITGPIVAEIQHEFFRNWQRSGHSAANDPGSAYFPELEATGEIDAEMLAASPINGSDAINDLFEHAVESAQQSLDLATAYFVPGQSLLEKIKAAAKRGTQVSILVCGEHIDERLVRHASRALWGELIEAGVSIYEYSPTLYHVKAITVDREWCVIGSANFDVRSCRINDELNIIVRNQKFAEAHHDLFQLDCASAEKYTIKKWRSRPLIHRALDKLATIFRKQL